jgi:hypothetical protein
MDRFESTKNLVAISSTLPNRRGKRPITIRGPLQVQCSDHGDDKALRHAFELRPLGDYPGMGRTAFLFKFWFGTARCDGCLRSTRRTRVGCMSIAVLGLLQFLPEQRALYDEKTTRRRFCFLGYDPRRLIMSNDIARFGNLRPKKSVK